MEETPKQAAAFLYYCTMPKRNLRQFSKDFGVGMSTAGAWSKDMNWQERVKAFDFDTTSQLHEIVIKDWVETKAYLLRVLMKQVIDGVEAGIKPRNTTEMVSAIREIRSIMGDEMHDDVVREKIMFVRDDEKSDGDEDI